LRVFIAGLVP